MKEAIKRVNNLKQDEEGNVKTSDEEEKSRTNDGEGKRGSRTGR